MTISKNVFLVLDTETADLSGSVYDVGFVICDNKGTIMAEYNALVLEVFTDPKKMMGAFFAGKVFTHYAPMLQAGTVKMENWDSIVEAINSAIEIYEVTCICAYNAAFDFRVMKSTNEMMGNDFPVLSHAVKTLDIWQFACETKLQQKAYKKAAKAQGWVSPKGNIKTGAEFAYRFCSGEFGFIEDHTALSDARIEAAILAECFRQKKSVPYNKIGGSPWRLVQEKAVENDSEIHGKKVA
jgi:hypothetical protein